MLKMSTDIFILFHLLVNDVKDALIIGDWFYVVTKHSLFPSIFSYEFSFDFTL